jgi:GNAT superfamily N-acetyltransferase
MEPIEFGAYFPGVVGKITEAHAVYYYEHWGFDLSFETQVGKEFSEFMQDFQAQRDGLWTARKSNAFAGSIGIDGKEAHSQGARLRWFIVLPDFQRTGIGNVLLTRAIEFCRSRNYPRIYLWTFKGLESARRLYERHHFRLQEEHDVAQWGQHIREQRFELVLEPNAVSVKKNAGKRLPFSPKTARIKMRSPLQAACSANYCKKATVQPRNAAIASP